MRWRIVSFSHLLQLLTTPSLKTYASFFWLPPTAPTGIIRRMRNNFICLMNSLDTCSGFSLALTVERWLYFYKNVRPSSQWLWTSSPPSVAFLRVPRAAQRGHSQFSKESKPKRTKNQRGKEEDKQWRDIRVAWPSSARRGLGHAHTHTHKRKSSLPVNSAISFLSFFPPVLNIIVVCLKN